MGLAKERFDVAYRLLFDGDKMGQNFGR